MSRTTTLPAALGVIALAGACLTAAGPVSASAARAEAPVTTAAGLFSPLSVAVAPNGTRYFSENFAGVLKRQKPGTKPRVVYRAKPGVEVGAVSERRGKVRFALSKDQKLAQLMELGRNGKARKVADLGAYETKRNPDRGITYGFRGIDAECAAQFPEGPPASYRGIVESHPYATAQAAGGTTYVADAAANAVLAVGKSGRIRTVAVLPPAPLKVSAEFAEMAKMPACAVGRTYHFESVPTDVEVGPGGILYVSTLPGGPEDGSLGAAASVYKVNPRTGKVGKVAGGLVSATGLAVSPSGNVFVAELFGGRIVRIPAGASKGYTFAQVSMPGDVEWTRRGIFATTNVLTGLSGQPGDVPKGSLVRFPFSRG
ncbi:ScyD/ScyE family protein [Nocardioides marmoriginsengisoli]|uniref:ScyD/ScyE family protein n=1 Tax=Nocardioides marmoriginsengisoli TaxID=661483 RepID=A0A3N0CK78_9ACTN|nr:ScyD/ScyE family protein [Nocardioides marmoriginsengisoli]RNL63681.1 ScyD/ScyE family protein [Nocardioides marmoriginsengisoli]